MLDKLFVPRTGRRRSLGVLWVWLLLAVLALALVANPVGSRLTRAGLLLCLLGLYGCTLVAVWSFPHLRYTWLLLPGVLSIPLLLPGRSHSPAVLRDAYVQNLARYEGVPYVWGGEKEWGIDCSGLPRRALIRATVGLGLRDLNGALVREAVSLWWHDCTARTLGQGYRGLTRPLFSAPSINALDPSRLQPGDLAVTANGVHVLVFIGGKEWLEADPGHRRVIRAAVPVKQNAWFDTPVNLVRWTWFSGN